MNSFVLRHALAACCALRALLLISTAYLTAAHLKSLSHCCIIQAILHGLFWLVWADCSMLLHVFTYNSVLDMPALPLLYVCLSPLLLAAVLLCYFHPLWVMSSWDSCCSYCRGGGRGSSPKEQEPLLHAGDTAAASDTHLPPQQGAEARS